MILRLSDSLSRGLVVVATLLVALWLSFFSIRSALARNGSEGDTVKQLESAVRLEPGNPEYWYILGRYQQFNLEEPDSAKAREDFRKTIALNPLATDAWLDLGTSYELEGKSAEAREAYLRAKQSYPTSADVSWRDGNFLLREGDQAEAYAELRHAIEADPKRAAAAFSRAYRSNPDIGEILRQLLPPKQSVYVDVIAEATAEDQLAMAKIVWAQLLTLHPRLAIREVDPLVSRLLSAGEFLEARRAWDQGLSTMDLPPLFQPQGSVVWDPSFESGINGYSFSWHYAPIAQGVSANLDTSEKLSGRQSLRLSFDGRHNPNLEAACTVALVQPGFTYRFSGWVKTREITTEQGIEFRLRSVEDSRIPPVKTREVHGTNPWIFLDQTWKAGPATHRVQICAIREPSENPDVRISGYAWVDDVNLLPQPAERHKP
jgi:tetratricopeptide (TPR) repeat protein